VREALLRLIQDRLIEARPRSGYQVRPLTRDSIDAFFVAWRAIAPGIAKVAFERISESLREELYDLGVEYQLIDEDDLKESLRLSVRMFDILVMATNNEPLTYIYHRLGAEMERVFLTFFETPAGREWRNPKSQMFIKLATMTDPHTAAARIDSKLAEAHRSFLSYIDSRAKAGDPLVPEK
jgi:DNA-binding GntR family transcriptional regulator